MIAGVDIGGTKTLAVAVDDAGDVRATARLVTQAGDGAAVAAMAASAIERLDVAVDAVGVGVPGVVDPARGTVRFAVNLGLGSEPVPLAALLADRIGVDPVVENDVNAAAVGACRILGVTDLAYLSIGTGVAAGLVLDGRLRRGGRGAAGEIGHLSVVPDGPACDCGQRGCLETIASGATLARRWPVDDGLAPAVALFDAAARGEPAAIAIRDAFAGHLAAAVWLLALTVDPGTVVLGGGVADAGSPLLEAVRAAVQSRTRSAPLLGSLDLASRLTLTPAGVPVGAIGAAHLAAQPVPVPRP